MKCPVDETTLTMSERSGIEIDYCPTCRGVWLDRGELDKIIDRAAEQQPTPAPAPAQTASYESYDRRDDSRDERRHDSRHDQRRYGKKRKESWLSELFD